MSVGEPSPSRVLPGPFSVRLCVRGAGGSTWIDRISRPRAGLSARHLDALRATLRPAYGSVAVAVPRLVEPDAFVYPAVATDRLLFDSLFVDGPRAESLEKTFSALGTFLAELHASRVEGDTEMPTARRPTLVPPWYESDRALDDGLAAARERLPTGSATPRLEAWAAAGVEPADGRWLVHGRFSSACIVATVEAPREVTILGWLEAAVGDRLWDLGYLLAELAEAVAAGALILEDAARLARAFVGSNTTSRGAELTPEEAVRLRDLAARRAVDHMTLRVWRSGNAEGLGLYLAAVEQALAALVPTARVEATR